MVSNHWLWFGKSVMSEIIWKAEKRKISELRPAPYNPRQLTEKQAKDLGRSLTRFNLADPIVINKDNQIIGGHQRINILKDQGVDEVDVRVPNRQLTDKEERELNLRLNKNLGEWDFDALANFDEEMLLDVGFESAELDKIFQLEPSEKDDEIPENVEPKCKLGDIYLLGRHRLMCGDSTKVADVERLMDGKKANVLVTSPPYWNQRDYSQWDTFDEYIADMCLVLKSAILETNAIIFWNIGDDSANHRHISAHHSILLEKCGFIYIDAIIWKKQGVTGIRLSHQKTKRLYYPGFSFENCLVFQKDNISFPNFDERYSGTLPISNVWEISTESNRGKKHSAPFPVALPETAIKCYSNDTLNNIYEPFCGSGTTLIACEKTNRICYGMELDPKYCDVIIKRWEDYTGQTAEKQHDGKR